MKQHHSSSFLLAVSGGVDSIVLLQALKNVDVNYAPNGWSAYRDGAPVQTTLTLGFEEIVLIDRDKVEQGF